jgi:hypothetical protein
VIAGPIGAPEALRSGDQSDDHRFVRALFRRLLGVVLLAPCSCAGPAAGTAASSPQQPVATAPVQARATPSVAVALPPVDAPHELMMSAHLPKAARAFELLKPLGVPHLETLARLDPLAVASALGLPSGAAVDLDRPIDFAMLAGDKGMVTAVTLAYEQAGEDAIGEEFDLVPQGDGTRRLRARSSAKLDQAPPACLLAPDSASGRRLVCGPSDEALKAVAPYVLRSMSRMPSTSDLRLELFPASFGHPPTRDANASEMEQEGEAAMGRVLADLGSMVLEARFDGTSYDATLGLRFATRAEPMTAAFIGQASTDGPALDAFEHLPRDSGAAVYVRGATPADVAPFKTWFGALLGKRMSDLGYASADVEAMMASLGRLFLTGGPWILASGHRPDQARAALDAYVDKGVTTEQARSVARAALQGWALAEVEEPPARWIEGMKELVRLDSIRPTSAPSKQGPPEPEHTSLSLAPVDKAFRLPAETLHVKASVTPARDWLEAQKKSGGKAVPVIPHTTHIFVVPDGSHTWFAFAEDPALAAAKARVALNGGPAETLRSRDELGVMGSSPSGAAGFVALDEFAMLVASSTSDEDLRKTRDALKALDALTAHGAVPVPIKVNVVAGEASSGTSMLFHTRLSVRAARDVVRTISRAF